MKKRLTAFLLFSIIFIFCENLSAASFNCSKASTPLEKLICSDQTINNLDYELGVLYSKLKKRIPVAKRKAFTMGHRKWLKARNQCALNLNCLISMYKKRLSLMAGDLSGYENQDNFVGTYKAGDDSCGLYLRIHIENGDYRYHLKTSKKDVKGFLFINLSDNIYFTFDGLFCDDCSDDNSIVTAAYFNKMIVIQNYGNSMNQYTKFNECSPKYIELTRLP